MAAAQLQRDHKHWLVLWGCYTHSYVAFPLFHAPRGTILIASAPGEMVTKMRREERSAGVQVPAPVPAPAPTPADQSASGHPGPGRPAPGHPGPGRPGPGRPGPQAW
jgi:hypothetical protein